MIVGGISELSVMLPQKELPIIHLKLDGPDWQFLKRVTNFVN